MTDLFQEHRKLVGRRVREARQATNMSHDKLGAAVGTSRQHLIKIEKGTHMPRAELLARIAEATGRDPSFFTSDEDDEESELPTRRERELLEALRPLARLLAGSVSS